MSGPNEFVIRFANINGTGSASANAMVAKSFFRMGLPIGPKNMFPSNIQGMPTWYEVRVSEKGYTGRRGGVDLMVAMNPQTFVSDTKDVVSGGYLLYDSTRHLRDKRSDITYIPVPLSEISLAAFPNPKSRGMLKNVVYVGAIAALMNIDRTVVVKLIEEQFQKKPKLIPPNLQAFDLGYDYCKAHFSCPLPIQVEARSLTKDQILIGGNDAAGLGCVYAGATVGAWYPITPSTSLVDAFAKYVRKFRRDGDCYQAAIVQAEDEISSIGMVLGAAWNGARSFTATSGPGISLMSEFIGYAYYAEIPAVIFNVQRCGPSTGMPTRTQQADLLLCAYASHGDTKHLMLIPSTPQECFEFAYLAFDFAERYQTPVFVMSDLELGMNDYVGAPLKWDSKYRHDRGKIYDHDSAKTFYRYLDEDGDGVPYRSFPGVAAKAAYFTRGSGHDKYGRYTEDGALYCENMERIVKKFESATGDLPKPEFLIDDASNEVALICIGTTVEPLRESLDMLRAEGLKVNAVRLRAFPFVGELKTWIERHKRCIVIDQNRDGQLRSLLMIELDLDPSKLASLCCYDGMPVMAADLAARLKVLLPGVRR